MTNEPMIKKETDKVVSVKDRMQLLKLLEAGKLPSRMTHGDKYRPALAAISQDEADRFFEMLVVRMIEHHDFVRSEAIDVERGNISYFSGYNVEWSEASKLYWKDWR